MTKPNDAALSAIAYVDRHGSDEKPNPMRDVYLEFPRAMLAVAAVTAFGAEKHAPRGWRTFETGYALDYHLAKIGRHLLKLETEGEINREDGDNLHMAAVAWNALAYLEHHLRRLEEGRVQEPENHSGPPPAEQEAAGTDRELFHSFIINCFVRPRRDVETLFSFKTGPHSGLCEVHMDGYAIIPREEYELLSSPWYARLWMWLTIDRPLRW